MEQTRRRITQAAVDLHGTVGPAATTISAVAERAGVTRATLYRHFPDEGALFTACSGAWLREHPRPDTAAWLGIGDPRDRVRLALARMYAYYRSAEPMLANLLRDIDTLPGPTARNLVAYPSQMLVVLDAGWPAAGNARLRRSVILHAVAFATWRSLTGEGASDAEASELMADLVIRVAESGDPAS